MSPSALQSLAYRHDPLAAPEEQVRLLESTPSVPPFDRRLRDSGLPALAASRVEVLQINVGKLCNQTCGHCHVDAGPDRREVMDGATVDLCLAALERSGVPVVDITGGAPELNPHFRRLVTACRLTVLLVKGQEDLAAFLAEHRVEIVASLPYYQEEETDAQRGTGVFARSIEALQRLNALGYGRPGTGLVLNLVHNPAGAYLPPDQRAIEADTRRELARRHGVEFNALYTITNMPISRFLEFLQRSGNTRRYMERLLAAFNPAAVDGLMCRTTLSVGWDGRLYDCDFNQMLALPVDSGAPSHIRDFDPDRLAGRPVVTGRHCYGCTAGAGSSCGGAIT